MYAETTAPTHAAPPAPAPAPHLLVLTHAAPAPFLALDKVLTYLFLALTLGARSVLPYFVDACCRSAGATNGCCLPVYIQVPECWCY